MKLLQLQEQNCARQQASFSFLSVEENRHDFCVKRNICSTDTETTQTDLKFLLPFKNSSLLMYRKKHNNKTKTMGLPVFIETALPDTNSRDKD